MKKFTGKEILKNVGISDVSSVNQSLEERNGQTPKFQKFAISCEIFPG
jgi:hypothetical protein